MTVDERSRLQLDEGIMLMELLPPVGWADVATKHDLLALEHRIDARFDQVAARFSQVDDRFAMVELRLEARFEKGFRQVIVTMASLLVTGFVATVVAVALR